MKSLSKSAILTQSGWRFWDHDIFLVRPRRRYNKAPKTGRSKTITIQIDFAFPLNRDLRISNKEKIINPAGTIPKKRIRTISGPPILKARMLSLMKFFWANIPHIKLLFARNLPDASIWMVLFEICRPPYKARLQ